MYQKTILKNGLRLITVPMEGTKAVTVLVLFGTGSKYETREQNGLSHFLEHMFFKGTQKRPDTLSIAETLDRVGGQYNAFTSKEMTGYWAKAARPHLDLVLDWVSDILLNSKFDIKEIDRERGVIIEEVNMYQDMPSEYVGILWDQLLYGDQPAGWPVIGTKENIQGFSHEKFLNYFRDHYLANNAVVVVAGQLDHDDIKTKIDNYFGGLNQAATMTKKSVVEKQTQPQCLVHFKKTDQTHFCLGTRAYNLSHPDKYALSLLAIILGGNMSSRLFIKVRERLGLAYYVKTGVEMETDTGYLVTQAGVDHQKAGKAISAILAEYQRIAKEPVSEDELKKAKDCIAGHTILEMESSDAQASFFADQELLENEILTIEEQLGMIEKVTVADLSRVARDIFQPAKLNMALIGPFKEKSKFDRLLSS